MADNLPAAKDVANELLIKSIRARREGVVCLFMIFISALSVILYFAFFQNYNVPWSLSIGGSVSGTVSVQADASVWVGLISALILRLGAVILAVFLMQILFSFGRNRFRVSDALLIRANAIILSEGRLSDISILVDALNTDDIGFGSEPVPQTEKLVSVICDVIEKIKN